MTDARLTISDDQQKMENASVEAGARALFPGPRSRDPPNWSARHFNRTIRHDDVRPRSALGGHVCAEGRIPPDRREARLFPHGCRRRRREAYVKHDSTLGEGAEAGRALRRARRIHAERLRGMLKRQAPERLFDNSLGACQLIGAWRCDDNLERPYKSLGGRLPWASANQLEDYRIRNGAYR